MLMRFSSRSAPSIDTRRAMAPDALVRLEDPDRDILDLVDASELGDIHRFPRRSILRTWVFAIHVPGDVRDLS
jgi:hypothetical protein